MLGLRSLLDHTSTEMVKYKRAEEDPSSFPGRGIANANDA